MNDGPTPELIKQLNTIANEEKAEWQAHHHFPLSKSTSNSLLSFSLCSCH
jgi:hypothetical protein